MEVDQKQNIEAISRHLGEPQWMTSWRTEKFEHSQMLSKDFVYGLSIGSEPKLDGVSGQGATQTRRIHTSGSVRVLSWKDAIQDKHLSGKIQKLFEHVSEHSSNRYFMETDAFFTNGTVVVVEQSKENALVALESVPRDNAKDLVCILAEDGSSVSVLDHAWKGGTGSVWSRNVYIDVGRNASVRYCTLQDLDMDTSAFLQRHARVHADAGMYWYESHTGGKYVKADTATCLSGERARGLTNSALLGGGSQTYDLYHETLHMSPHSKSDTLAVGVLGARSKVVYRGETNIRSHTDGAQGKQDASFLLTSSECEIDAVPALDIAHHEISSLHSLSIRNLTEDDTFYFRTRGLNAFSAQRLLVQGHLEKSVRSFPNGSDKRSRDQFERKLASNVFQS